LKSGLKKGYPPEQQTSEGTWAQLLQVAKIYKKHTDELTLLNAFERRCHKLSNGPGQGHYLCSQDEDHVLESPLEKPSKDLISGRGRRVKMMGQVRVHPTASFIQACFAKYPSSVVRAKEQVWVMKRWQNDMRFSLVSPADAAIIARMTPLHKVTDLTALETVWRDCKILDKKHGEEFESIINSRVEHFFVELTVVEGDPIAKSLKCWCEVFNETGECGHQQGLYQILESSPYRPLGEYVPAGRVPRNKGLAAVVGKRAKRGGRGRGRPASNNNLSDLAPAALRARLRQLGLNELGQKRELVTRLEAALDDEAAVIQHDGGEEPRQAQNLTENVSAEEIRVPADVLSQHHSLFTSTDQAHQVSVCWWLRLSSGVASHPVLHTVLRAEQ
jgi:hypothetical protein